jgi:hypothetical protein
VNRKTIIEIDGVEYEAQEAVVYEAHLGLEPDHGIFTINIDFRGVASGWGQGTGHYAQNEASLYRWVKELTNLLGPWQQMKGREVWVLRTSYSGPIVGLASKNSSDYVMIADLAKSDS